MNNNPDRTGRAIVWSTMALFVLAVAWAVGHRAGERARGSEHAAEIASWQTAVAAAIEGQPEPFYLDTVASFYGEAHHGKLTASGEPFDRYDLTAASPWLALGTVVDVQRLDTGRSIRVRINDRGPHMRLGRGLDLSEAAAISLGMVEEGVVTVRIRATKEDQDVR